MRLNALVLLLLTAALPPAFGQTATTPVLATPHFAFYSDLRTNTHDALIAVATARRSQRPGPFSADEETCFKSAPDAERQAWDRAVDDYVAAKSTRQQRLDERWLLAGLIRVDTVGNAGDSEFLRRWSALLDAATSAYRRCRWSAQDTVNRRWIDHVKALLATYEQTLGEELPRLFATGWAGLPFRIDVVNIASFDGANSVSHEPPATLHVLVSSVNPANQGLAALETVFHEASHFLAQPESPLNIALKNAAEHADAKVPPDFLHEVQFFITGEAVRRALAARGETYTPDLFALKLFSDRFRENVPRVWMLQIDGRRTLEQAADDLVRAMN